MVGQPTVTKPSRSDEVLDPDQQLRIADQVRAAFESKAPKRPIKPNRSESTGSQQEDEAYDDDDYPIPEYEKLQSLKSQVVLSAGGAEEVQEEFVETEYYDKLVSMDKQHHTTGTGFIRVDAAENGSDYELYRNIGERKLVHITKSNPATNDWIPTVEDGQMQNRLSSSEVRFQVVDYVSSKPSRSG